MANTIADAPLVLIAFRLFANTQSHRAIQNKYFGQTFIEAFIRNLSKRERESKGELFNSIFPVRSDRPQLNLTISSVRCCTRSDNLIIPTRSSLRRHLYTNKQLEQKCLLEKKYHLYISKNPDGPVRARKKTGWHCGIKTRGLDRPVDLVESKKCINDQVWTKKSWSADLRRSIYR